MKTKIEGSFQGAEAAVLQYGSIKVGRKIWDGHRDLLVEGRNPFSEGSRRNGVFRGPDLIFPYPRGQKLHFFPDCGKLGIDVLARSIRDTTCLNCLMRRARRLRGWRWKHLDNQAEVRFLESMLGDRVSDFGSSAYDRIER